MAFHGDIKDAEFWKNAATQLGSLVKIKDIQANEDAMNAGRGLYLEDREVKSIRRFKLDELDAEWIFFYLPGDQDLWLMVCVVGQEADAYVLYRPFEEDESGIEVPVYEDGNRSDLLKAGFYQFFDEPDDADFIPAELCWTCELVQEETDKNMEDIEACFVMEDMETQFAVLKTSPHDKVMDGLLCGITEYHTDNEIDDPHIVIVETGIDWNKEEEEGKEEGGFIEIYQGCHVDPSDIDFDTRD